MMMDKHFSTIQEVTEESLSLIKGGGKNEANLFLSGMAGAAEGVLLCAQAAAFMPPQMYMVCAAGGAISGVLWPH